MDNIERRGGQDRRIVQTTPAMDRRHGGDRRQNPSLRRPDDAPRPSGWIPELPPELADSDRDIPARG